MDLFTVGVKVNSELAQSSYIFYVRDDGTNFLFNDTPIIKEFLNSLLLFLNQLHLSSTESAYFYRNLVLFAFDAQRDLIAATDHIVDFIVENQNIFTTDSKVVISSSKIPENLKPLLPYIKKYAISDDGERDQLIEEMNASEKSRLIKAVKPLFNDINTFLDSFKDEPLSEEAMAIGELAELVSELDLR